LNARFSPDDRWITYQSDESSRVEEVYVIPFAQPARSPSAAVDAAPGKKQVSVGGGIQAHWRRDGKELFYFTRSGSLMAVDVMVQGSSLQLGRPHELFAIPRNSRAGAGYDVSADGTRFLVNRALDTQTPATITVVLNWTANFGNH
jgi:hypothetical protein